MDSGEAIHQKSGMPNTQPTQNRTRRPLQGQSAWLITDGKVGMDVQVKGLAEALGLDAQMKHVSPTGIWKFTAPWGPADPKAKVGIAGTAALFAPPWPAVCIATGRASIPYVRALEPRRQARRRSASFCRIPRPDPGTADLIWVPAHDRLRGLNVITTPTAPHSFSPAALSHLRQHCPPQIAALPGPRVAVILGGKNGIYRFTEADDDRFQTALTSIGRLGASFMVTPSRRSHQRLVKATLAATEGRPRLIWEGEETNPIPKLPRPRGYAHRDSRQRQYDRRSVCYGAPGLCL